jgi:hypothetical protein
MGSTFSSLLVRRSGEGNFSDMNRKEFSGGGGLST